MPVRIAGRSLGDVLAEGVRECHEARIVGHQQSDLVRKVACGDRELAARLERVVGELLDDPTVPTWRIVAVFRKGIAFVRAARREADGAAALPALGDAAVAEHIAQGHGDVQTILACQHRSLGALSALLDATRAHIESAELLGEVTEYEIEVQSRKVQHRH